MDEKEVRARVRSAGLEAAFAQFPDDVRAAIELALSQGAALAGVTDVTIEPWPPMQPGERL